MIHVRLMGGMGNQMFQYALAKRLAIRHRTEVRVDLSFLRDRSPKEGFVFRNYELGIFDVKIKPTFSPYVTRLIGETKSKQLNKRLQGFVAKGKKVVRERSLSFDRGVLDSPDNSLLIGYWQSEKYFTECQEEIRECFSLNPALDSKQEELLGQIGSVNSVCLNVRRGDFVDSEFHGTQGVEYFSLAAARMSAYTASAVFFVFSDDADWCEQHISLPFETYFVDHTYAGASFSAYLKLMVFCNHFVIPNSTFGWWAAWLGNHEDKIVIAPGKWFKDERKDTSDLIPPSWIRM